MTREEVIKVMNDYRRKDYSRPEYKQISHKSKYHSTRRTYEVLAAEELIEYVNRHNDIPIIEAVENFRKLVHNAAMEMVDCDMFGIAYDVASDFLDLIINLGS